jgi:hypothetical protein
MDAAGTVSGPTVDWLLRRIETALVCEHLDRRDLEG